MLMNSKESMISGLGNGPIDAFISGLSKKLNNVIDHNHFFNSIKTSLLKSLVVIFIKIIACKIFKII